LQVFKNSTKRIAFVLAFSAASLSFTLGFERPKGRFFAPSAISSIKNSVANSKTEEIVGEGKNIDYTLYNYGKK
jgi:hypothetical protein